MRLGDHAFAHYADDDARWELFGAFCALGLANGEKVLVLADPAVPDDEAYQRLFPDGGFAEQALASGQLMFHSMRALVHPDRRFTAERQISRLFEETERARWQGYAGLRAIIDMMWVPEWDTDVATVLHRETHADALFARRQYAELCAYDRRVFEPEVIEAMRVGHPVAVLERPGDLDAYHSINGLHLIGDADMATRDQFVAALGKGLADAAKVGRLLLDLSRLAFMSAACAADLLRLVAQADGFERVDVHCSYFHANVLRRLGSARIRRLTVTTALERP
ncbi:MAG TPA: MEDS domain-containing protein [Streptosporangiaceae bacterium]|nr:MEDS domain-containing protein [Streptosporangiaceae bacterium]